MKKLLIATLFVAVSAHAGDYQHQSALLGICKMQAKMGMMIAHAKKTGEPSAVNVAMFRDGDPGLYELTTNTERIALENADMGSSSSPSGSECGVWITQNRSSASIDGERAPRAPRAQSLLRVVLSTCTKDNAGCASVSCLSMP